MIKLDYFHKTGIHHFNERVNVDKSTDLLNTIFQTRPFGPELFIDEEVFKKNPQFKGVNPIPGRNLAENLSEKTLFIERDDMVGKNLNAVLGKNYKIKDKKFVCGVPLNWIPKWVKDYIDETGVKNLGPYVKPEYRDITYFCGIDFHQDIIDWPEIGPNFITMYVYLDDVSVHDAPLHVIPRSHLFGATKFPHKLKKLGGSTWKYSDDNDNVDIFEHQLLTGKAGDVSLWHPFILHGTQPDTNSKPRISLRYLIQVSEPGKETESALDILNSKIQGDMKLSSTRLDLNESGKGVKSGNHVNQIKY